MSKKVNILPLFRKGLRNGGITLLKGLSHLPFWMIYAISDLIGFILCHVVRYRREVVHTNLKNAFPEKTEREIAAIARKFYRHFADSFLEIIKGSALSWESLHKRITFSGIEEMNARFEQGKSILLLGMHYGNWEWNGVAQPLMKHQYLVVFNPMRNNPEFERYLGSIRERWGTKTIRVDKSAKTVLQLHKMEKPVCLVLGGDQRPPAITHLWTTFLNQEACFNAGVVKIARHTNQPVFSHITRNIRRGYYEASFIPLIENPADVSDEEILLAYVRSIEKFIREAPEYYLWSHRRWKQKRPEGMVLIGEPGGQ